MTQPNVLRRRQRGTATLGGAAPSPTRREGYRSTGPPVGRGVATVAGPGERAHAFEATGTTLGQRQAAAQSLAEEQVAARREAERSRVQALRDDARAEHESTQAGLSAEFDAGVPAGQQAWDSSFALAMNTAEALQEIYDWRHTGGAAGSSRPGWGEWNFLVEMWQSGITGFTPAAGAAWSPNTVAGGEFGSGYIFEYPWGTTHTLESLSGLSRSDLGNALAFLRSPETLAAVESFRVGGGAGTDQMAHRDRLSADLMSTFGVTQLPLEWRDSLILSSGAARTFNEYFAPGFAAAAALGAENVPSFRPSVGGYQAEEYLPPGLSSEEAALGITP